MPPAAFAAACRCGVPMGNGRTQLAVVVFLASGTVLSGWYWKRRASRAGAPHNFGPSDEGHDDPLVGQPATTVER